MNSFNFSRRRSGFTLVELLIVITISGLLILAGLFTFGNALRRLRLQMLTEDIVTLLQSARTNSSSGVRSDEVYYCNGVGLSQGTSVYSIVRTPFDLTSHECDVNSAEVDAVTMPSGVVLSGLVDQEANEVSDFVLLAYPPKGTFAFYDGNYNEISSLLSFTARFSYNDGDVEKILTVFKSGNISN